MAKYKAYRAVDVSQYQGTIDFQKLRAGGYRAVIVRAGPGKEQRFDPYLYYNIDEAQKAGMLVGCYYVPYTKTHKNVTMSSLARDGEACAVECAELLDGLKLDLPVFIDYEYANDEYFKKKSGMVLTAAGRTKFISSCAEALTRMGYHVGIYTNHDYLSSKLTKGAFDRYPLFLAQYVRHGSAPSAGAVPQTHGMPMLWQYDTGRVPGCNTDIDLDYYYVKSE